MTEREFAEYSSTVNQLLSAQGSLIENLVKQVDELNERINTQDAKINYLISYSEIRKQGMAYINKSQLDYELEKPIKGGENNGIKKHRILLSMTTYPARMYEIKYALLSLLSQSVQADEILLWLSIDEFPEKEKDIAPSLLDWLKANRVTIKWCENNYRVHNKMTHALREYPDDIIVSADDDIYYPHNWLQLLYEDYLEHGQLCAHRAHKVLLQGDTILPYNSWGRTTEDTISYCNFLTGVGGVLYPPHCLHEDVTNDQLFTALCPNADDIWLWGMAVRNHQRVRVIKSNIPTLRYVNIDRELGFTGETRLSAGNVVGGKNDGQISNLITQFPEIIEILKEENQ